MMLQLDAISGGYGDTLIHRDLSMTVGAGEVVAIVGRNGTGKTTMARLITGELPLSQGALHFHGQEIGARPAWARARLGIASMPQTGMVFDGLSVAENLALTGANTAAIRAATRRFPRLTERATQRAGSMSGGERKMLGFVRTVLMPGSLLVLDEPSEGVQPENIAHMQNQIKDLRAAGKGVLLLEQNVSMVMALADRVIALDVGGIAFTLDAGAITRDAILQALRV